MEQVVEYCKSADGVRIAYATVGAGPPLVFVPGWLVSHLEFGWRQPDVRAFYEGLANNRMLVRYDRRGTGLSDRDLDDFSAEAQFGDLEAVVDRLDLQRFALMGWSENGSTAISYAARHPDRVSHLILYNSGPRWPGSREGAETILALIRQNWRIASAALAAAGLPSGDPTQVATITEAQRVSATSESAGALLRVWVSVDVTSRLKDIQAPTLIAHRRGDPIFPFDVAREMAGLIPGARLVPLQGDVHPPWWGDTSALLRAIDQFLETRAARRAEEGLPSGTAPPEAGMGVILFLDIAGSTELTTQLGDAAYREKERELDGALRAAIREAGGSPVEGKVLGDGVLAVFSSASNAIDAALRCGEQGRHAGLPLHAGIHAGDVIREDNNVHGGAVQVAARIADASQPGEVLVSATVRDLARTSAGVSFEDRGERALKGVSEPVRVFAVRGGE